MPSIRLLDLTNLVALSPAKHFFNRLLARSGFAMTLEPGRADRLRGRTHEAPPIP